MLGGAALGQHVDRHHLPAASSDEHIWFVAPDEQDPDLYRLFVHGLPMDGPHYRGFFTMSRQPEAMAAWDQRVWLVMSGDPDDEQPQRQVLHLKAQRLPVQGLYVPEPENRFRIGPSLPGRAVLAGLAGTKDGPVVLLSPEPRALSEGGEGDDPDAPIAERTIRRPTLLRLVGNRWVEIALPDELSADADVTLAAGGDGGNEFWVLTVDPDDRRRTRGWRRAADAAAVDAAWQPVAVDLALRDVRGLTRVGRHVAAVSVEDRDDSPVAVVRYVRRSNVLELARVEDLMGHWAIVGMEDGLRVIERSTRGELRMREITSVSGRVGEGRAMTAQPLETSRIIHGPIMIAIMVTCLVLWAVMRPADPQRTALPKHLAPMPIPWRLQALAIDLLPGAVLGPLLLGRSPVDVIYLPVWTADLERAMPAVLMVAITIGHGTVLELVRGRSFGKGLFGASVVNLAGEPLAAHRVIVRNLFKAVILLIPPIGVLALLNPYQQGIGELVTQSVVVYEPEQREAAASEPSDGAGAGQKSGTDRDES